MALVQVLNVVLVIISIKRHVVSQNMKLSAPPPVAHLEGRKGRREGRESESLAQCSLLRVERRELYLPSTVEEMCLRYYS